MGVLIHAAPHEMLTIGGAAVGAFLISNSKTGLKHAGHAVKLVFKGEHFKKDDYKELLLLLFALTKLMKTKGMVAIEQHIEKPEDSEIFRQYSHVTHDSFAVRLICDYLRVMTMDLTDANALEDAMEKEIDKHLHEELHGAHAIQTMADGIPALGIVAAVLGVIKTMASISEPPEVLGEMIGGALVGTFLGVFLAYGFVGPFASRSTEAITGDIQFYRIIKEVLVAHLKGCAPQISMEIGRGNIPSHLQPSFQDMEAAMENLPTAA
ncbi:MAG: flagellar motor stator protein MotA [Alphaproteobacteria bacterium]|nr:flagellar motor stator protein MotA [Alphaproteobacteria bacterium]